MKVSYITPKRKVGQIISQAETIDIQFDLSHDEVLEAISNYVRSRNPININEQLICCELIPVVNGMTFKKTIILK